MFSSNSIWWRKPPAVWSYGIAVVSVGAALIISRWSALHLQDASVSLFLCAVLLSAWFGGVGSALFATALSALAFYHYYVPPIPRLVIFVMSTLLVGSLSAALRSAAESLRRAHQDLIATVRQLQRSNEALQAESRQRELAQKQLRRSEAFLSDAQRLSHTGSFAWRPTTGEILWSEETFRIFQYDRTTTPTVEFVLQRVHPEDVAPVKQIIERASQDGKDFNHAYRLVMPDGAIKHVQVVAHAETGESGEVEFVGAVMDSTASKLAEKKLRRSEESLLEAQRLSHTGSWRHDVASGAVTVSPEIYRMHDIRPDEDASNTEFFFSRFHPDDRKRVVDLFERAETEKTEFQVDYRIVLPDGTIKHLHTIGRPILNGSGELIEFVGTAIDVTEGKQATEELRQAQAELAYVNRVTTLGELTASLAHEVNQPIAAAVTDANTCLRWLARDYPDVDEASAAAARVVKDTTRAAEIINRVRLLFKKGAPEPELVDINEVIPKTIILLYGEAARYDISVRAELVADLPCVIGDRVQLQQVIMNLIVNSIDAMKDVEGSRELVIRSQRTENEHVLVSVIDTGVGLPQQQISEIFNAFFTTKSYGTGLGLRISRSIVEAHGGRLWAADNSPRGASFCFTLPSKPEMQE